MENSNIQSINSNEENQMTSLQQIFQQYVEQGGKPAVTHFRLHLNKLIDQEVKHLCGRSSKSGGGDDWRSEVNARFGGRGAKWVFVSLDDVKPTLDKLDSQGIDTLLIIELTLRLMVKLGFDTQQLEFMKENNAQVLQS